MLFVFTVRVMPDLHKYNASHVNKMSFTFKDRRHNYFTAPHKYSFPKTHLTSSKGNSLSFLQNIQIGHANSVI